MTTERLDEETLAAFLDGTLSPEERSRVVALLARDPAAYADFLEASQVLRLSSEPTPVVRGRPWRRHVAMAVPLLAAAAIAGAVFFSRSAGPADAVHFMERALPAALDGSGDVGRVVGPDWDQPQWAVSRGTVPDASPGTVARIGARWVQLTYAARAADTAAVAAASAHLTELLGVVDGAAPVAQEVAQHPFAVTQSSSAWGRQLRELTGASAAFDLGVWLETVRLGLRARHAPAWDARGASREVLQVIVGSLRDSRPGATWEPLVREAQRWVDDPPRDASDAALRIDSAMGALPR